MTAKACAGRALAGLRGDAKDAGSRQALETAEVAPSRKLEEERKGGDPERSSSANVSVNNGMRSLGTNTATSISRNPLSANELSASACRENSHIEREKCLRTHRMETFLRWCRFNLVGAIGIVVQLAALFLLKSIFHFNYLAATAVAVEAAVVHNFVWHEQFTWADRVQPAWRTSLPRFARFNLTTGGVSIIGNLALMKVMVGLGHMNYFAANAIAIVLCSVVNFLVSDEWVFERE